MSYNPRIEELERKVDVINSGAEVPQPSGISDAGKVMTVNETGTGYELMEPADGLPEVTSADAGKVLSVNSDGTGVEWKKGVSYVNLISPNPFSVNLNMLYCYPAVHGTSGERPDLEYANDTEFRSVTLFKSFITIPIDYSCLSVIDEQNLGYGIYLTFDANSIGSYYIEVNGQEVEHSSLLSAGVWTGTQWNSIGQLLCLPITGDMTIRVSYND